MMQRPNNIQAKISQLKMRNYLALGLLLLFILLPLTPVDAEGELSMSANGSVAQGNIFYLSISLPGSSAGVDAVQIRLDYDQNNFTFDKSSSVLLDRQGSAVDGTSSKMSNYALIDNGDSVQILFLLKTAAAPDDVIATLAFVAKPSAAIGNASFQMIDNSFASMGGSKYLASREKLTVSIEGSVSQQLSENPLPPENYVDPAQPPAAIDVPYDPNNQLTAQAAVGAANGAEQRIDLYYAETSPAAAETAAPAMTTSTQAPLATTTATTAAPSSKESPLKTEDGTELFVPREGLPLEKIPSGFQGSTENQLGVTIPIARSSARQQTLYYLRTADGEPFFYTYIAESQRFRKAEENSIRSSEESVRTNSFRQGPNKTWRILGVSLLGLSSLSVMLYSVYHNLREI